MYLCTVWAILHLHCAGMLSTCHAHQASTHTVIFMLMVDGILNLVLPFLPLRILTLLFLSTLPILALLCLSTLLILTLLCHSTLQILTLLCLSTLQILTLLCLSTLQILTLLCLSTLQILTLLFLLCVWELMKLPSCVP